MVLFSKETNSCQCCEAVDSTVFFSMGVSIFSLSVDLWQVTRALTLAEEREIGLLRREIGRVGEEIRARAEAEAQRARVEAEWRPSGTVCYPFHYLPSRP